MEGRRDASTTLSLHRLQYSHDTFTYGARHISSILNHFKSLPLSLPNTIFHMTYPSIWFNLPSYFPYMHAISELPFKWFYSLGLSSVKIHTLCYKLPDVPQFLLASIHLSIHPKPIQDFFSSLPSKLLASR